MIPKVVAAVMIGVLALEDVLPTADALGDALVPIGGVAGAIALIRLAVAAHDKRATTAEEREKTCTTALANTVAAQTLLTEEVRAYSREGTTRLDNGLRRLEAIERLLAEKHR